MKKVSRIRSNMLKKYNKFIVVMGDDSIFEYDLKEYDVFRGVEWVEVENKNNTEMDCFFIGNIMRVRFTKVDSKTKEISYIKPVPPTAA